MATDQIVYLMIGSLSIITCLFMFLILLISRFEIKNSQRQLSMDLILHYNHCFHKMYLAFEKYQIRESSKAIDLYLSYEPKFKTSVRELSSEITKNCVHNKYVFITSHKLKEQMILCSKELVEVFQTWTENLKKIEEFGHLIKSDKIEDEEYFDVLWDTHLIKYDMMIRLVSELQTNLTNDSVEDILRIKRKLS
ncbi:MAG: hypothetical protein JEZ08_23670 [Clostridiales bacterium]|nr:hypothetical protein [Clostridiales bacterium]